MRDFHLPGRSPVFGTNGMAATSNPLASKVAIQMLEAGGNAVDAAIAAAVLQGLLEPQMTGIGGDCFVLLKVGGNEEVIALNGSGRAPEALDPEVIRGAGHTTMPTNAPESVTIPGAVDAFCKLSKDFGKLGLAASLSPAIYYMNAGVPIGPRTAYDWKIAADHLQGAARDFFLKDGKPFETGQIFKAPKQAEVLQRIAAEGRAGFYEGEVAEDMVASLQALGGVHTVDDFSIYESDYHEPISGAYKQFEMLEHPPNGQGATAILMNNILAEFDLASLDPMGVERAHIEAEATKLAYDARNRFIADSDLMTRLDHMLDPQTGRDLAAMIDQKKAMKSPAKLSEAVHKETICLSVVDKDLMSVSLIYSVFHSFGSGLASDKFGINFQNRGAGFTLEAGHANEAGGGKRPMHTIIPGMLRQDDKVVMPFGVMGGAYQPCGHSRFVSNLADFDMDIQAAMDAPRCFANDGVLAVERGYSDVVRQGLMDLGHAVETPKVAIGGSQAIWIDRENGVLIGGSDHRKDGAALGY